MGDMQESAFHATQCHKSAIKMLSELDSNKRELLAALRRFVYWYLRNQEWRDALRDARKAADEFDPKPN